MTISHKNTELASIPEHRLNKAKADILITYNHTTHDSHIITGMNALAGLPEYKSLICETNALHINGRMPTQEK